MNRSSTSSVLIAFGSNMGDSDLAYQSVQDWLPKFQIQVVAASEAIRTVPIGSDPAETQEAYLNAALLGSTSLTPQETMSSLLAVEKQLGRIRDGRWRARTVDLDLLLFGQQVLQQADLICPHPRMSYRRFVLAPAAEIAPEWVHPVSGRTMKQLLGQLDKRPAVVLWIGDLPESLHQQTVQTPLGQQIRTFTTPGELPAVPDSNDSVWLRPVSCLEDYLSMRSAAKLVVISDSSAGDPELIERALRFEGAVMKPVGGSIEPMREFLSAIDAMI